MSYGKEIRERVVKYRLSGHTIKETSKVFRVGNYAVSKWVKQYKETDLEKLKAYAAEHPDDTGRNFGCVCLLSAGSKQSI